jgi:hypothetical protein
LSIEEAEKQRARVDERLDDVSLLARWCLEVDHKTGMSKAELAETLKFLTASYFPCNDISSTQCELMEVGGPAKEEDERRKLKDGSWRSDDGPDTTNTFDASAARRHWEGTGAYLDSRSTASFIGAYASDPRVPETRVTDGQEPVNGVQADNNAANDGREAVREPITTFMLRNIPNRVKVEALQQRMCDLGFGETYDFLYMPFDLQSEQNKGYAFVNLCNETVATDFQKRFNGIKFEGRLSSKEVLVCKAAAQGVAANLRTITHSNWLKKEHMPIVRVEGHLIRLTPRAAHEMLRIQAQFG